jgi:hypothetical protein
MKITQQMRNTYHNDTTHAHSDAGPNWGHIQIVFIKSTCYYWHHNDVISKSPKQVYINK